MLKKKLKTETKNHYKIQDSKQKQKFTTKAKTHNKTKYLQ